MNRLKALAENLKNALSRARERFPVLDIAMRTFKSFSEDDGGPYAAALTYYTFFSIFPMLLFGTAVLGFVLANYPDLKEDILNVSLDAFPLMGDLLRPDALDIIENNRRTLALTAIPIALYSGLGGIAALTHALNVMLDVPRDQEASWLGKRIKALKWLLLLTVGALLSIALGTVANFSAELFGLGEDSVLARTLGHLAGFCVGVFIFVTAFKVLPAKKQTVREVLPGAILAAAAFELLKIAGAAYLEAGARGRNATFGALASAAALLVASFLTAQITLLAAELNAVLSERKGNRNPRRRDAGAREEGTPMREQTYTSHDDGRVREKSAGELMKEVTEGLSTLIRKEIELAKQEIGASVAAKVKGVVIIAVAAVFALFALIFLLFAIRDGFDTFLWTWVADLATAGVLIAIGVAAALIARGKLAAPISADMTKQTIKEDVEWAKTLTRR